MGTMRHLAQGGIAVGLLLVASFRSLMAGEHSVVRWEGRTMGTVYVVQVVDGGLSEDALAAVKLEVAARLQEVNRQMSHYLPESELRRFNDAPAHLPFKVSVEFARVVRFALELSRKSKGAFDPTLGSLVNLWGFGEAERERVEPAAAELEAVRLRTGWDHLAVTGNDELVKDIPDLALNLSALAKGFGVDEMGRVLRSRGLSNWYVAIAGEVLVSGQGPRGDGWRVGIAAPVENWRENDPMAAGVSLRDQAISTSGDYQAFFHGAGGRRYSHIIDPRSGSPVEGDVGGVSVVAPDCVTADGLATTLFVLGPEQGLRFLEAWPGTAALFVRRSSDGTFDLIASEGFPRLAE